MSTPWAALGNALAEGITLGAETLCPRDHVGERRHQAAEAALAGEPGLSDDELIAIRGLIQERYETRAVVDAEIHCDGCQCPVFCRCGREIFARERPDGSLSWFHRDDLSPITEACADRDAPREDDADPPTAPSRGTDPHHASPAARRMSLTSRT